MAMNVGREVANMLISLLEDEMQIAKVELQLPSYIVITANDEVIREVLANNEPLKHLEEATGVTIKIQ